MKASPASKDLENLSNDWKTDCAQEKVGSMMQEIIYEAHKATSLKSTKVPIYKRYLNQYNQNRSINLVLPRPEQKEKREKYCLLNLQKIVTDRI